MVTFNTKSILIDHFVARLESAYYRLYGELEPEYPSAIRGAAIMAMEVIAKSDALYHDVEHSIQVTLVGQEMLRGKYLLEGSVGPRDWVHVIVSLLCHDIGYVRGICPGDREDEAVCGANGARVNIPFGATDAFLTPYHIERGKLFVRWRFRDHPVIDPEVVAANIERTRFPVPAEEDDESEPGDYSGLVRAADLIGQLADPDYLRKLGALFYEFEETGATAETGARTPEDLRDSYPQFYWNMVSRHVERGIAYLRATQEGRQWEASLYSHIFAQEHRAAV